MNRITVFSQFFNIKITFVILLFLFAVTQLEAGNKKGIKDKLKPIGLIINTKFDKEKEEASASLTFEEIVEIVGSQNRENVKAVKLISASGAQFKEVDNSKLKEQKKFNNKTGLLKIFDGNIQFEDGTNTDFIYASGTYILDDINEINIPEIVYNEPSVLFLVFANLDTEEKYITFDPNNIKIGINNLNDPAVELRMAGSGDWESHCFAQYIQKLVRCYTGDPDSEFACELSADALYDTCVSICLM